LIPDAHETVERVSRLMREVMHIEVDTIDTDLIETGSLDSLALVDLIFQLEQELGVSIQLGEVSVEGFRTVRGIAELLARLDPTRDLQP